MIRQAVVTTLLLSVGVATITARQPTPLEVTDAWVYAPLAGRSVTGGFAVLTNTTDARLRIVEARSAAARVVELHEMTHEGGMMRMRKLDVVEVAPHASRSLRPGGDHVMLIDIASALKPGDEIEVVLVLDDGREVRVAFEVRAREGTR